MVWDDEPYYKRDAVVWPKDEPKEISKPKSRWADEVLAEARANPRAARPSSILEEFMAKHPATAKSYQEFQAKKK